MYGGRVIDDFDRRVVKTYMDEYMGDFLFDTFQPFNFYADDSFTYAPIAAPNRDEFIGKSAKNTRPPLFLKSHTLCVCVCVWFWFIISSVDR